MGRHLCGCRIKYTKRCNLETGRGREDSIDLHVVNGEARSTVSLGFLFRPAMVISCFTAVDVREENRTVRVRVASYAIKVTVGCAFVGPVSDGEVGWERRVSWGERH